jgi:hypothetical protein
VIYRRYTIHLDRDYDEDSIGGDLGVLDEDEAIEQVARELQEAMDVAGLPIGGFQVVAVEERDDDEYGRRPA